MASFPFYMWMVWLVSLFMCGWYGQFPFLHVDGMASFPFYMWMVWLVSLFMCGWCGSNKRCTLSDEKWNSNTMRHSSCSISYLVHIVGCMHSASGFFARGIELLAFASLHLILDLSPLHSSCTVYDFFVSERSRRKPPVERSPLYLQSSAYFYALFHASLLVLERQHCSPLSKHP